MRQDGIFHPNHQQIQLQFNVKYAEIWACPVKVCHSWIVPPSQDWRRWESPSVQWRSFWLFDNHLQNILHRHLCIQASTCCRSSTSSFHIRLWSAASSERSAIFTARMTGSGETAWMTPITMTYLPAGAAAAGGQLLSDSRFKETKTVMERKYSQMSVVFTHVQSCV